VGKDFSEADKGRKFGKGGFTSTKAKINKQNTRHGKMDMPFASLNKYAGMAKGGDVKKEMKAAGIFAKAGEKKLAAHERREAMGKEKDTPAIAKKEMSVLKKSKAPKDVMDYEEDEHKSMGFARGGGIESKGKTRGAMVKMATGGGIQYPNQKAPLRTPTTPSIKAAPAAQVSKALTKFTPLNADQQRSLDAASNRGMKSGGSVKKFAKGGGIESKGKTRGKFI
jgi:hypothetical protein